MNYAILGAGKSGMAAAKLAVAKGGKVFLSESKPIGSFAREASELSQLGVEFEFGGNTPAALSNADCLITSPGVPPCAPIIKEAESRGIAIISEMEFGRENMPENPLIAITGTNGKTTTTALITYILQKSGLQAIAAGNIGTPISALAGIVGPGAIIVAEASSYQLDRIVKFRPDVAIILNITPDHLAYHGNFGAYCRAKYNITRNQSEKDLLILNADDAAAAASATLSDARVQYFSSITATADIYCNDRTIFLPDQKQLLEDKLMLNDELRLPGAHNRYNSMAAALAARAYEVRNENIRDSLMSFSGVEHRLEFVRHFGGANFVNDSKATNVNATWYALSSYSSPIVWIVGGRGDNNDYSLLDELVAKNVRCIIAIGEEQGAIFDHFCLIARCIKAATLEDAVKVAAESVEEGDVALFSPACKSFDMFANYEHRGQIYKQAVLNL